VATIGGKYGYSQNIFYVDDPNNNRYGNLIQFFVNGVDSGATASFSNGESTELNLAVTIATQPTNNPHQAEEEAGVAEEAAQQQSHRLQQQPAHRSLRKPLQHQTAHALRNGPVKSGQNATAACRREHARTQTNAGQSMICR